MSVECNTCIKYAFAYIFTEERRSEDTKNKIYISTRTFGHRDRQFNERSNDHKWGRGRESVCARRRTCEPGNTQKKLVCRILRTWHRYGSVFDVCEFGPKTWKMQTGIAICRPIFGCWHNCCWFFFCHNEPTHNNTITHAHTGRQTDIHRDTCTNINIHTHGVCVFISLCSSTTVT